jgi:hypothetical protein
LVDTINSLNDPKMSYSDVDLLSTNRKCVGMYIEKVRLERIEVFTTRYKPTDQAGSGPLGRCWLR